MSDVIAKLTAGMADTAHGYAAVIDGVLNIRSATLTANAAAFNALTLCGFKILSTCKDVDCDCMVKALAELRPDVKVVQVKMGVVNG